MGTSLTEQGLLDRIAELEEELRQMREAFIPFKEYPPEWKLFPAEARILAALEAREGFLVTHEHLHYASKKDAWPDTSCKIVAVHVSRLRKKIPPNWKIENRYTIGYRLVKEPLEAVA